MIDYLQLYLVLNMLATVFYSSSFIKTSPLHKDYLKSLLATVLVALLGIFIVIWHSARGNKNG
jgi:hypothetical protein